MAWTCVKKWAGSMAAPTAATLLLAACQTSSGPSYDYTEFERSNPRSILVVQPANASVEVKAPFSVLAQTTKPLAESGYYVFPVALVNETFRENGIDAGEEIQQLELSKLKAIYGPDAILFIDVQEYGTKYQVISSVTKVSAKARLLDANTGTVLWQGESTIVVDPNQGNNSLLGAMVSAVVNQIAGKLSDKAYGVAGQMDNNLLSADVRNRVLYGPYHSKYTNRAVSVQASGDSVPVAVAVTE